MFGEYPLEWQPEEEHKYLSPRPLKDRHGRAQIHEVSLKLSDVVYLLFVSHKLRLEGLLAGQTLIV